MKARCKAILLSSRKTLVKQGHVTGVWTMRLYRERSVEERERVGRMTGKRGVREWLEANGKGKDAEMK